MLDDITISRAITETFMKDFIDFMDVDVANRIASEKAIENRDELMVLYDLIAEHLGSTNDGCVDRSD